MFGFGLAYSTSRAPDGVGRPSASSLDNGGQRLTGPGRDVMTGKARTRTMIFRRPRFGPGHASPIYDWTRRANRLGSALNLHAREYARPFERLAESEGRFGGASRGGLARRGSSPKWMVGAHSCSTASAAKAGAIRDQGYSC